MKQPFIILFTLILLAGCASSPRFTSEEETKSESRYKKGRNENPRTGRTEIRRPENTRGNSSGALETVTGVASFYSEKFHGKKTASGEIYDMHALTAAHETYPFNTIVQVFNLKNNKSVILRINDRKPDLNGRIIDVSLKAARELDMVINGIAHVQVDVIKWGK